MDTMKSFKGYGKVDPKEEDAFKRKTRKRLTIIVVSVACLLAITIGIVVGTFVSRKNNSRIHDDPTTSAISSRSKALEAICSVTNYPKSCYSSISSMESSSNTSDPKTVFQISVQVAYKAMKTLSVLPEKLMNETNDPFIKQALSVCEEVFDDAIDMLKDVTSSMKNKENLSVTKINDLKTWLSTVITDQETCLDALVEVNATIINDVKRSMKDPSEFASNSLAIVSKILNLLKVSNLPTQSRKLLTGDAGGGSGSGFPHWVGPVDRKLLLEINLKPDVTVAQDGSGDVDGIGKAVAMAIGKKGLRFVIYVKAGLYKEIVRIDKSLSNVMMYGDGKNKTVVSFDRNTVDGTTTFFSATFAVVGKNFIARDMGFKNAAGAIKEQAVALRSNSDQSVFYRCSFDGFQDTLYTFSNRQFYKECDITGTVDFIFGNAAVIFQDCNIMPRQPLQGQYVTITAQGKKDSNQNSGICIQNCILTPLDNLTAPTYLGRPWKNYSTTVIMQSNIGGFLNPEGWTQWAPDLEPPSSIFYAEYQNKGPGANVTERVKWAGYLPTLSVDQAAMFSVKDFLGGENWITDLGFS